jgi:periplasmic protein TonB
VAGRTYLFAISLGAHAALGVALAAIPARVRHEVIAISLSETAKPKPTVEPAPPPPPDPPEPTAHPVRAKSVAAPPKATDVLPENPPSAPVGDALPDFGLSLSNGGGAGLAVPPGGPHGAATAPAVTAKTLSHAAHAPVDDCGDPPAKPKALSRPTPAYTAQARTAGITGKVRVEITVDEQGRVVAVRVLQGLGYGLDEAALAAARAMKFEAAVRCGKPSSANFRVGFNFAPGTP